MKSVALHNLGCKVNAYEMDIMQDAFVNAGYKIVPFDQTADIYVINTCSVTNIADRKSRQMLHKAKAKNPSAIVVAAGCYVNTRGKDEVLSDDVDVVVSNTEKAEIANIVGKYIEEHDISTETVIPEADVTAVNSIENAVKSHAEIEGNHTRAFIKVQDGCEMYCSYCIIPYARGQIRSRSIDDVTSELKSLVADGYHEFVITGIHLSSYGIDKIKFDDTNGDHINFAEFIKKYHAGEIDAPLLDLIDEIAKIDGVDRIRFGSLEPRI
ncbi:MAG: radical SAM protein, partial [Lachnospiraceae bacterium]|nr:radical SAM protein [Lachnospiraceae bacterium]